MTEIEFSKMKEELGKAKFKKLNDLSLFLFYEFFFFLQRLNI